MSTPYRDPDGSAAPARSIMSIWRVPPLLFSTRLALCLVFGVVSLWVAAGLGSTITTTCKRSDQAITCERTKVLAGVTWWRDRFTAGRVFVDTAPTASGEGNHRWLNLCDHRCRAIAEEHLARDADSLGAALNALLDGSIWEPVTIQLTRPTPFALVFAVLSVYLFVVVAQLFRPLRIVFDPLDRNLTVSGHPIPIAIDDYHAARERIHGRRRHEVYLLLADGSELPLHLSGYRRGQAEGLAARIDAQIKAWRG